MLKRVFPTKGNALFNFIVRFLERLILIYHRGTEGIASCGSALAQ